MSDFSHAVACNHFILLIIFFCDDGKETRDVFWGTENKAFSAVLSTDTFLASQQERLAEQSYAYRIARCFDSGL